MQLIISRHFRIGSLLLLLCAVLSGCGKGGGGTPPPAPPVEAALVFTISPDPGSTTLVALSATQDISVSISSALPTAGVTAEIVVKKDSDNSTVFTQVLTTTTPNFTFTIQNLTSGTACTATITLTSKSLASNKATKTFKIARK